MLTREQLIEFENEIAECFNNGKSRSPVHLYHGNEAQMIKVFREHNIGKEDWVFCSWRSHYQCLLKAVPKNILKIPNALLSTKNHGLKIDAILYKISFIYQFIILE